jgi:hypothetical protein
MHLLTVAQFLFISVVVELCFCFCLNNKTRALIVARFSFPFVIVNPVSFCFHLLCRELVQNPLGSQESPFSDKLC